MTVGGATQHDYERDRVPLRVVFIAVGVIVASLLATHLVVYFTLPLLDVDPLGAVRPEEYAASRDWGDAADELRRALASRERANLTNYRWLDDAHTAAQIPIERAKRALLEREGAR